MDNTTIYTSKELVNDNKRIIVRKGWILKCRNSTLYPSALLVFESCYPSLSKFAEACELGKATISRVLSGKLELSYNVMLKMCKAVNKDSSKVFGKDVIIQDVR